jgi:hypothetical protein
MYNYLDSSGFIACIYFPVLIVMGSFFFLNLFLAVITDTFSEMSQKTLSLEQERSSEEDYKVKDNSGKAAVAAMIDVTKKITDVKRGGIGNLASAALMFMAQER